MGRIKSFIIFVKVLLGLLLLSALITLRMLTETLKDVLPVG